MSPLPETLEFMLYTRIDTSTAFNTTWNSPRFSSNYFECQNWWNKSTLPLVELSNIVVSDYSVFQFISSWECIQLIGKASIVLIHDKLKWGISIEDWAGYGISLRFMFKNIIVSVSLLWRVSILFPSSVSLILKRKISYLFSCCDLFLLLYYLTI